MLPDALADASDVASPRNVLLVATDDSGDGIGAMFSRARNGHHDGRTVRQERFHYVKWREREITGRRLFDPIIDPGARWNLVGWLKYAGAGERLRDLLHLGLGKVPDAPPRRPNRSPD